MNGEKGANTGHIIGFGRLATVWMVLMDLTALSVLATRVDPGRYKVLVALAIACVKGTLVIGWFMHMRYEKRLLYWFLLVTVVTLTCFIGFTFFDVLYR
jgi:cytochrome c oxidase subunit 4